MVSVRSRCVPRLYIFMCLCSIYTSVFADTVAGNCHKGRIYVNLFQVLVDNNSNLQSVIAAMKQLGFAYRKKVLSIEQDYQRIRYPTEFTGYALFEPSNRQTHRASTSLPSTTPRANNISPFSHVTVTVGVLDIGFDMEHPNLRDKINVSLSYNYLDDDHDPSPPYSNPDIPADNYLFRYYSHGTMCMGIIGSTSLEGRGCYRGICDHVQLAGLKILDVQRYPTDTQEATALTDHLDSIDAISASYGFTDNRGYEDLGQSVKEAMRLGVEQGRECKGRIYVRPSGNGDNDNCNMDGYVKNVYTITVSNVGPDLQLPVNVERCTCTLAAAIVNDKFITTAIHASCVDGFVGSSAAVPVAVGHIVNMLKVNPTLTKRDIEHIIVRTASQIGFIDIQWRTNGAGYMFNDRIGFGVLAPRSMLEMAKIWHHVPGQSNCVCAAVNNTVDVKTCKVRYLEHVEVQLEMCCSNCFETDFGDIDIDVNSPMYTASSVMTSSTIRVDQGSFRDNRCKVWTFMSVQFWGEDPIGEWKVNWTTSGLSNIEVKALTFRFYGTTDDPRYTMGKLPICNRDGLDPQIQHTDNSTPTLAEVLGVMVVSLATIFTLTLRWSF